MALSRMVPPFQTTRTMAILLCKELGCMGDKKYKKWNSFVLQSSCLCIKERICGKTALAIKLSV